MVPALNDEEVTVESALTKGFEKIVAAYVDPVWNTISSKSKEILNDMKIFRLLLTQLTKADCITFFSTLCQYTSKNAVFKSSWVLTKAAEQVITTARSRVFPPCNSKQTKQLGNDKKSSVTNDFEPEVHPKWLALSEILKEISNSTIQEPPAENDDKSETFVAKLKTLIFTEDVKTCTVLKDYLCHGSESTLAKIVKNCDNITLELSQELKVKVDNISNDHRGVKRYKRGNAQKGVQNDQDNDVKNQTRGPTEVQITLTQIERKYEDIEFLQTPVFIRPLKFSDETFAVSETLDQLKPDVIIIFDPCNSSIFYV